MKKLTLNINPNHPLVQTSGTRFCCRKCKRKWLITQLIADYGHHNGWEMPPYTEYGCPKCGEIIEDMGEPQ